MRRLVASLVLFGCASLFLVGCASSSPSASSSSSHPVASSAPLRTSGDRCHDGNCTCRVVDDFNRSGVSDERDVPEGQKRFEIRTGRGLDAMDITVQDLGALKKSAEIAEPACGYLNLAPGKHHVHVHARATSESAGMVPSLWVNEWSARTHDWYDTFQFKCGGNEPCTKDHMGQWSDTDGKKPRGVFDPCGSSRIEGIRWDVSHSPDVRVQELDLDFVINVYKFVPRFPHGSKSCKGVGGVERQDEPQDLPQ